MNNSSNKLKRLVKAQSVLENQAKGAVFELAAELEEIEYRLEETQKAFTSTSVTLIFSDFYIGHLHMLQARCVEVRQLLEAAQIKLQSETMRAQKLQKSLRSAQGRELRNAEESETLERVERGLFRTMT